MERWSLSEFDQKLMNAEVQRLKIFNEPQEPLYHYTSREVFWKILESESFLARHILFSNDSEENRIGTDKVRKAMKKAKCNLADSDALPFMICFCKKKDLLSQWRGYAKEGVAFEFDFSKGLYSSQEGFSSYYCYTIMNADDENEYLSEADNAKKFMMGAIASPYEVIYTNRKDKQDQTITRKITEILKAPKELWQQYAVSVIPYIKNEKFIEEEECRLIFDMRQLIAGEDKLLSEKYVYLDMDGVKKPNIRVKFGNQYKARNGEEITIYYFDPNLEIVLEIFKNKLESEHIKVQLVRDPKKYAMKKDEILLSEGKDQEKVCIKLRRLLYQKRVKIWCDGHMPIRKIYIGPSKDAELMKASIKEYIKTKYWMIDIKVVISNIPLRS